jgi:hypothetical protein
VKVGDDFPVPVARSDGLRDNAADARGKFLIEMAGNLFMALGGFLLQQRRLPASRLPSAVAWLPVGMGATVVAAIYAFMIGSYRAAARMRTSRPYLLRCKGEPRCGFTRAWR